MKNGLIDPNILPMPDVHPTPSDLKRVGKLSEHITMNEDQIILIENLIMITAAIINGFLAKNKMISIVDKNRRPKIAILFLPPIFLESITNETRKMAKISTL